MGVGYGPSDYFSDSCTIRVFAADIKSSTVESVLYQGSMYIYCEIRPDIYWHADSVSLVVKDSSGQAVKTFTNLYHYGGQQVGYLWNGKDDSDEWVPPGDYTIEFTVEKDGESHTDTHDVTVWGWFVLISQCDSNWLPRKYGDTDYRTNFTVSVVPDPQGPFSTVPYDKDYLFTLAASINYGYCTNRQYGTGDHNRDLRFDTAGQPHEDFYLIDTQFGQSASIETTDSEVSVSVSSYDYGAYGTIRCDVTIGEETFTAHVAGDEDHVLVTVPIDDNGNHIGDAWIYDLGQSEYSDADESENNNYDGDGLTAYDEYRGVDLNGDGLISSNERLNPNIKDLFVEGVGFGTEYPFVVGSAFADAGIQLHVLGTSEAYAYKAALRVVQLSANDTVAHLELPAPRSELRYWYPHGPAGPIVGTPTTVFVGTIACMFVDKPYVDGATKTGQGQWNDPPNGVLDWLDEVEDVDDDGELDAGEDQDGNSLLTGDHFERDEYGDHQFDLDLTVYDIDNDGRIEWPMEMYAGEIPEAHQFSKAQIMAYVVAHEIGHNVGMGECGHGDCCMVSQIADPGDSSHFCDYCKSAIRIKPE
jgi:hypothetical protein